MKALSRKRRSIEQSLSLAREGMDASSQEQARVGSALRAVGLTVPLVVAPSLVSAAQVATSSAVAAGKGLAGVASVGSGAHASGVATASANAASAAVTSATSGSTAVAAVGGKLIAGKIVAGKIVVALALAGASTVGIDAGYNLLGPQASAPPTGGRANARAVVEDSPQPLTRVTATTVGQPVIVDAPLVPGVTNASVADPAAQATAKATQGALERRGKPASTRSADVVPDLAKTFDPLPEDPFVVEMQHLKQVNRALSSGNPRLALERLNALDRAIPRGSLQQERQVSRVLILCALGETAQAVALTQQLLRQNDGFYSRSLKNSCGAQ